MENLAVRFPGGSKNRDFRDPAFESLIDKVRMRLSDAERAIKRRRSGSIVESKFKDLCRSIRDARMEFQRILEFYGCNYDDNSEHLVQLSARACELAEDRVSKPLSHGLQEHADDIQAMQMAAKDAARA
jgi:hypothetical protein